MRLPVSWLKLALPAALPAAIFYSSTQDAPTLRPRSDLSARNGPGAVIDPHVLMPVQPDTARPPPDLPPPGASAASFAVKFKDEVSPYSVMAMFVMPGDTVSIEAVLTDTLSRYAAEAAEGRLERVGEARWRWTAPETKGVSPVVVRDSATGETITLNAFVLLPRPDAQTIGGFRLGRYESRALRGDPNYVPPLGLVEVTEENRGTFVAPHFTLGQFVSKQPGGYPKYLVLRERLLLKLEMLLEEASRLGLPVTTFQIMSGYRTPYYNRSIGNQTRYSRHLYGDAADIYVDEDGDGVMDDLNGDGRVDLEDAKLLAGVVERLSGSSWYRPFVGGLGLYRATRAHGPFVHVDVRGHVARWGW